MTQGKGSSPRHGRYRRPLDGAPKVKHPFFDNRSPQEKYEDNWDAVFGGKKANVRKVVCSAYGCQSRRKHWCDPDTSRGPQLVEVPDDWPEWKPAYCSMTCALLSGAASLAYEKEEQKK